MTFKNSPALASAANAALVLAGLAVFADRAVDLYSRVHSAKIASSATARPRPAPFRPGTRAPDVSGVDYGRSDRTLVLFLSTKCKYCIMSAPFYRELSAKLHGNARSRMVAVFPQAVGEVNGTEDFQRLGCETVPGVALEEVGVASTPTMLLVSKDGRVIHAWIGAPNEQTKRAIISAMIS